MVTAFAILAMFFMRAYPILQKGVYQIYLETFLELPKKKVIRQAVAVYNLSLFKIWVKVITFLPVWVSPQYEQGRNSVQ